MIAENQTGYAPRTAPRTAAKAMVLDKHGRRLKRKLRNGDATLLSAIDGRSLYAKRFREIAGQLIQDQGGDGELSEVRLQLLRRFATTCVLAEQLEVRMALDEAIDPNEHGILCSTLVRIANKVGLERVPKSVDFRFAILFRAKSQRASA